MARKILESLPNLKTTINLSSTSRERLLKESFLLSPVLKKKFNASPEQNSQLKKRSYEKMQNWRSPRPEFIIFQKNCFKEKRLQKRSDSFLIFAKYIQKASAKKIKSFETDEEGTEEEIKPPQKNIPIKLKLFKRKQHFDLKAIFCSCQRSKCSKNYCICYLNGIGCGEKCTCIDCKNSFFERKKIKTPKKKLGCNCKRSRCLKRYCECFQAGLNCNENCNCVDCLNCEVPIEKIQKEDKIEEKEDSSLDLGLLRCSSSNSKLDKLSVDNGSGKKRVLALNGWKLNLRKKIFI